MPIFRLNDKLVYYAHVPKAGGSSVADYFASIGARTAFAYGAQWRTRPSNRWSSTSPQHIDAKSLLELFPDDFFDACFTVVRHPEERIKSEYRFRVGRSQIHASLSFTEWLRVVTYAAKSNPFVFDGHIRPQIDFVPVNCKVFKLEEDLTCLGAWLSETLNIDMPNRPFSQHSNKSEDIGITMHRHDRELIKTFYSTDFDRFAYERKPVAALSNAPLRLIVKAAILGELSKVTTKILSHRIPY